MKHGLDEFDERFPWLDFKKRKAIKTFFTQKLEAQASRLLIEITANCKATTEALMEEARKEARDGGVT